MRVPFSSPLTFTAYITEAVLQPETKQNNQIDLFQPSILQM